MVVSAESFDTSHNGHAPACLLVTPDRALARAFREELRGCAPGLGLDVRSGWQDALQERGRGYGWVAIDLDCPIAPAEAVRLARLSWAGARVALISCWWSERDQVARDLADVVVHKPLRTPELALLLDGAAAPQRAVSEPLEAMPAWLRSA